MKVLAFCCVLGATLSAAVAVPLAFEWPKQYTAEGTIYLPYAEIAEPFTAVVDMTKKMSSMDTYHGTAVIVNRGDMGDYGTVFKTVPETTKDFANRMTCFKIPGFKEAPVDAQGILPDLSLYKYIKDVDTNRIYESTYIVGSKMNNYTLMVDKSSNAPTYLVFTGLDRVLGSHYDQYIIEYHTFKPSINDTSVFNVDESSCVGFPGPGETLAMAENPMFEFVGSPGYSAEHQSHKLERDFSQFKETHKRNYETDKEEEQRKFNFRQNHRYIHSMNRRDLTYKLGVNHMTDLSDSERKQMRGYRHTQNSPRGETFVLDESMSVPTYFNWRLRGAVTPVKDQAICGSCWSFGTTGSIEGSYFLKHKILIQFSEQALVDCSWGYGNNACDGGESERAYRWIIDNGCIPTSESYGPYTMQDGRCNVNASVCGAKLSKFYNTPSGDTKALVSAIYQNGPISIAIDASHKSFSFYANGVYYEDECGNGEDDLDHQVLAVGYGTMDDKDFFLVKNSWSTHWGMDGYILMSRKDNNCGIATDASYADVV